MRKAKARAWQRGELGAGVGQGFALFTRIHAKLQVAWQLGFGQLLQYALAFQRHFLPDAQYSPYPSLATVEYML